MTNIFFPFMPAWAEFLIGGIALLILLISSGIAIGKTGRNPSWALLLLVPVVQVAMVWMWAYSRWPRRER